LYNVGLNKGIRINMDAEPITAAAHAVEGINNYWQVISLAVIGLFAVFGLWITRVGGESKKLIAKSDELEKERTAHRAATRDAQFAEMKQAIAANNAEVKRTVEGQGRALDKHIENHAERDKKTDKCIEQIDSRLRVIESNLILKQEFNELKDNTHRMDKTLVELYTIIKERLK